MIVIFALFQVFVCTESRVHQTELAQEEVDVGDLKFPSSFLPTSSKHGAYAG